MDWNSIVEMSPTEYLELCPDDTVKEALDDFIGDYAEREGLDTTAEKAALGVLVMHLSKLGVKLTMSTDEAIAILTTKE